MSWGAQGISIVRAMHKYRDESEQATKSQNTRVGYVGLGLCLKPTFGEHFFFFTSRSIRGIKRPRITGEETVPPIGDQRHTRTCDTGSVCQKGTVGSV